ncbi:hypothetical protein HOLleu_23468 [Holothuria leucospilota]|uniref:Uncharacterized protein n=1 Tax=Holothuria leucospilota TaxID=206669 RepID=A0A9Q1H2Y3_HOLLE|nr:hypothetical protein HOLleu_23468 [Holothuria leucospilota]
MLILHFLVWIQMSPLWRSKIIQVSYLVRRGGDSEGDQGDMPLSVEQEEVKDEKDELICQNNSSSTTYLDKGSVKKLNQSLSNLKSGKIQVQGINLTISYRLKIVSDHFRRRRFTICLTNVEFKQQTNLPIWLLSVIISIVILVCLAGVGVVIRQRKLQVHQKRAKVDVEKEDTQSRQTKEHSTSVKEDTCHPSFGQDLLNDKDEDDHPYCEIDIKQPPTNNLIYNSAYESVSSFR